ncbi:MAG: PilN domain-containing protein [Acidobacteria bacterium]|nr:PilN domain-containing protein [Acidobacteriota bacterium]
MIKINLLGITPSGAAPAAPGPPVTALRQALYFVVGAVVAGVVVFFFWAYWNSDIKKLDAQIAKEVIEQNRLKTIQAENQRYLAQRQQLERRINTIQQLINGRSGPVDLMINIGNIVNKADDLYILTMVPDGARTAIKGQASSVNSIANLISNLKNSGVFQDVQLRQYYQDDQFNRLSFKFNIDFVYKPPAPAPPAGQQQAAAPGTAGRPAGQ